VATREEKIAYIQSKMANQAPAQEQPQSPTRADKIAFIQSKLADQPEEGGVLNTIGSALHSAAKKFESYTSAPARAAIGAIQDGKNPITAGWNAVGEDPALAPTGKQIAQKAGLSERPAYDVTDEQFDDLMQRDPWQARNLMGLRGVSRSGLAGFGIDIAVDPTNLLGAAPMIEKGIAKAISSGAKGAEGVVNAAKQFTHARQAQSASASAEAAAKATAAIKGGGVEVEQGGKLFDFKAPQTLEELRAWKPKEGQGELVGKQRLDEIHKIVPDLEMKPLKYHYSMMENPKSMKELKLNFENLPTEDAKKLASYHQGMVDESAAKTRSTIDELSGGKPMTLHDAGDDLISTFKNKYNEEKEALAPAFEQLSKTRKVVGPEDSMALISGIANNSKVGKLIAQDGKTGRYLLTKNTPRTGVSDAEHGILSKVVDDLNDGMSFKELQDTRDYLRKAVDPANPAASSEINNVRKILLDQMENMAAKHGPSVRDTFKGYATNERARENVEKVIGGKIESLDAIYNANPDRVVKKIFSNPNYVKVVGDYVGPEKMKQLSGAYIESGMGKAFDPTNGFNPSTARNWLRSNKDFVQRYAGPETFDKLSAIADHGYLGKRFLDEVNPSGTAASLKAMIEPRGFMQKVKSQGIQGALTSETLGRVDAKLKQRQSVKVLQEALGEAPKSDVNESAKFISTKLSDLAKKTRAASQQLPDVVGINAARKTPPPPMLNTASNRDDSKEGPAPRELKGSEKWAGDGLKKIKSKLSVSISPSDLKDPKVKSLLVMASDLKPESPAMKNLIAKLEKQLSRSAN
jgi:hypothetical protein